MPVESILSFLIARPIWSMLSRGLLEHIIDALAEADDRVIQGPGRLLARVDVLLELAGDAVELLDDGLLVVLHGDRLVEDPDDGELVVLEVAEDLAGELVEGDADLLDVEDGIAGDLAAAAEVGGRRHGEQVQRRAGQAIDLDPGQARPLVDRPLPAPRTRGVADGRPLPMPPATITPPPSSPPSPPSSPTPSSPARAGRRHSRRRRPCRAGCCPGRHRSAVISCSPLRWDASAESSWTIFLMVPTRRTSRRPGAERIATWTTSETLQASIRYSSRTFRRRAAASLVTFGGGRRLGRPGSAPAVSTAAGRFCREPPGGRAAEPDHAVANASGSTTTGATSIVGAVN